MAPGRGDASPLVRVGSMFTDVTTGADGHSVAGALWLDGGVPSGGSVELLSPLRVRTKLEVSGKSDFKSHVGPCIQNRMPYDGG